MKVISGKLTVRLPGVESWQDFGEGAVFVLEANKRFQRMAATDTTYLCLYR